MGSPNYTETGQLDAKRAEVWGFVYETLLKRGFLFWLFESRWIHWEHPAAESLNEWRNQRLQVVLEYVRRELGYRDPASEQLAADHLEHLAFQSFSYGYTVMRALSAIWKRQGEILAIWCPIAWPTSWTERERQGERWAKAFGLRFERGWQSAGRAPNADFILWRREGEQDELIVVEFSRDINANEHSWRHPEDHQQEVFEFIRKQQRRGWFTQINTGILGNLPLKAREHLPKFFAPLLAQDRPFFKLCQAASYGKDLVEILRRFERLGQRGRLRVVAVTASGIESLTADWGGQDPRWELLKALGEAYQNYKNSHPPHYDRQASLIEAYELFCLLLPTHLRRPFLAQPRSAQLGSDLRLNLSERISDYAKPYEALGSDEIERGLEATLSASYRQRFAQRLSLQPRQDLRAIHAAAVQAAILEHRPGLNLLGLAGNPGIGKTTAIQDLIQILPEGVLFFYFSPRLAINQQVSQGFAERGVVALRTDAFTIACARDWYRYLAERGECAAGLNIEGGAVFNNAGNLIAKRGPIAVGSLLLIPEDLSEVLAREVKVKDSSRYWIKRLNEREDQAQDAYRPAVMYTLGRAARYLIEHYPELKHLALTVSIQAHRRSAQTEGTVRTFFEGLVPDLFSPLPQRRQRSARDWARRFPRWILMIDEITGDGAGVALVRALGDVLWMHWVKPFAPQPPLTLSLVIADASLLNEQVMGYHLNLPEAPPRVYLAPSAGNTPFAVTCAPLLNDRHALHLQTNSFPAEDLRFEYRLGLYCLQAGALSSPGQLRKLWRKSVEERRKAESLALIHEALAGGARQVLYFAQDRELLSGLWSALREVGVKASLITSQVSSHQRKPLLSPPSLASTQVFLITSSASRGLSFPLAEVIIAEVPTFAVEAHFMELAQLIYRGRGRLALAGHTIDGDRLARRLVFVLADYVLEEEGAPAERRTIDWLSALWNLLSALILLRASLLTRITGDAGYDRPLAVVPVGRSAVADSLSSLFKTGRAALRALDKLGIDPCLPKEIHDMAQWLRRECAQALGASRLSLPPDPCPGQFDPIPPPAEARPQFYQAMLDLRRRIGGPFAPLLPEPDNKRPWLSDSTFVIGPIVKVQRPAKGARESLLFDPARFSNSNTLHKDLGRLIEMTQKSSYVPPQLLSDLRELRRLLRDEKIAQTVDLFKEQVRQGATYWTALPADWWAIYRGAGEGQGGSPRVPDPEEFHELLSWALGLSGPAEAPVVPEDASYPYATCLAFSDPSPLSAALDSEAVACSRELNLANALFA